MSMKPRAAHVPTPYTTQAIWNAARLAPSRWEEPNTLLEFSDATMVSPSLLSNTQNGVPTITTATSSSNITPRLTKSTLQANTMARFMPLTIHDLRRCPYLASTFPHLLLEFSMCVDQVTPHLRATQISLSSPSRQCHQRMRHRTACAATAFS